MSATNNQANNYPFAYSSMNEAYELPTYSSNNGSLESLPPYSSTDLPPVYTTRAHTAPYASSGGIDLEAQPRAQFPTAAPHIRAPDMVHYSSPNPFASNMESTSLGTEVPTAIPAPRANCLHAALRQSTIRRNQQRAEFSQRDGGETYRHLSCHGFIGVLLCCIIVSLVIVYEVKKPSPIATAF